MIEEEWIGVGSRSWASAAEEAGWLPDGAALYCPRCGTSVGAFEADAAGCSACRERRLPWSRAVRLGPYEGPLRDAVLAGKYTAWKRVCLELGRDLGDAVADALRIEGVAPEAVLVCPVPTSLRRRLARGIDHTGLMARAASRSIGCRSGSLLRRAHRPPQQGLSGEARRRNVAGSFRARAGGLGPGGRPRRGPGR
ncbi:MAG: ComF family protein [Phycisphaerales bacterium]|nr:ComF family protein [Phycisphaerales bacterium]